MNAGADFLLSVRMDFRHTIECTLLLSCLGWRDCIFQSTVKNFSAIKYMAQHEAGQMYSLGHNGHHDGRTRNTIKSFCKGGAARTRELGILSDLIESAEKQNVKHNIIQCTHQLQCMQFLNYMRVNENTI